MSLFDDLPDPVSSTGNNGDPTVEATNASSLPLASTTNKRSSSPDPRSEEDVAKKVARSHSPSADTERLLATHAMVAARRGERPDMQDVHVILEQIDSQVMNIRRLAFYAVYDGHSGTAASQYAAKHLHQILLQRLNSLSSLEALFADGKRLFAEVYRRVDEDFLKVAVATRPPLKDGTTATTVLLVNNMLLVANVGDTRAVLYRAAERNSDDETAAKNANEELKPLLLTSEHNPAQYSERQRIQRAGGQVIDGRISGIIEVSRSLGDAAFKRRGVICLPDLRRCALNVTRDRALVLACDGLWNCFTVDQVGHELASAQLHAPGVNREERHARAEKVCAHLAGTAVRKLSGDNVTVLLVTFD